MKAKRMIIVSILVMLSAGILAGCSSATSSKVQGSNPETSPKTIYVGTQPDFPPFDYTDESGNLTGYDVELIREINKHLPEYKFEFVVTPWDGITLGLDSNKTQIIADQMSKNEEREKKYYLSEPYFTNQMFIIVKKGRTDIQSLDDLKGKTLELVVGTTPALKVEEWNAANGKQINIKYTKATNYSDPLQDVANGRVDAVIEGPVNLKAVVQKQNLQIEAVGKPVLDLPVYFIFRKDELGKELKGKVDTVIKHLKEDGTMKALSVKWTGGEYIPQ